MKQCSLQSGVNRDSLFFSVFSSAGLLTLEKDMNPPHLLRCYDMIFGYTNIQFDSLIDTLLPSQFVNHICESSDQQIIFKLETDTSNAECRTYRISRCSQRIFQKAVQKSKTKKGRQQQRNDSSHSYPHQCTYDDAYIHTIDC